MISFRQRNTRLALAATVFSLLFFTDQDAPPSQWFWSTAPGTPDVIMASIDGMPPSPQPIEAFPVNSAEYDVRCSSALALPRSMLAAAYFRDVILCNAAALRGPQLAHAVASFQRQVDSAYDAYDSDVAQELTVAFVVSLLASLGLLMASYVPTQLRCLS